jgi:hypothetical protein
MRRICLLLGVVLPIILLPGCMTLFDVAPGPSRGTSFVLAGRTPFPMGRVSVCRQNECGEIFTHEDVDGLKIQRISADPSGKGVWAVVGSPLMYRGKIYYCRLQQTDAKCVRYTDCV